MLVVNGGYLPRRLAAWYKCSPLVPLLRWEKIAYYCICQLLCVLAVISQFRWPYSTIRCLEVKKPFFFLVSKMRFPIVII